MQDPNEIWRASLTEAPRPVEEHPPAFLRAEAWPYPELDRVWVRLETSAFDAYPNLELLLTDPDGEPVSNMFMVEMRETYQSLTLHLRQAPRPGERYRLTLELSRDEQVLDARELDVDLVFRDPKESKGE
jgi:hypothetical protein